MSTCYTVGINLGKTHYVIFSVLGPKGLRLHYHRWGTVFGLRTVPLLRRGYGGTTPSTRKRESGTLHIINLFFTPCGYREVIVECETATVIYKL